MTNIVKIKSKSGETYIANNQESIYDVAELLRKEYIAVLYMDYKELCKHQALLKTSEIETIYQEEILNG